MINSSNTLKKQPPWAAIRTGIASLGLLLGVSLLPSGAEAKTLALEGSDAAALHNDAAYTEQLIAFLREGSVKPVAVFAQSGEGIPALAGSVVYLSSLTGLSTADYSALYIVSPGECCSQNLTGASGFAGDIAAFYAGATGGSVAIQNYTGGDWSFIDSVLATPPSGAVRGFDTGGGGPGCTDAEIVNAQGLLKGFTQPPALGCWEHQAYDMAYFGPLGFLSLVDSDPAYGFSGLGSAFLALGGSLGTSGCTDPAGCGPSDVPEPVSMTLLGAGLAGLGTLVRRRRRIAA